MDLFGNCLEVLDRGYAASRIQNMLTPVPNSTLWIDTQKERKKSDSPRTFW